MESHKKKEKHGSDGTSLHYSVLHLSDFILQKTTANDPCDQEKVMNSRSIPAFFLLVLWKFIPT